MTTPDFVRAIESAIVTHSPQRTNTPVDLLAQHMADCLESFETTLLARAEHPFYGRGSRPCAACEED